MVKNIMRDPLFLSQKSETATKEDRKGPDGYIKSEQRTMRRNGSEHDRSEEEYYYRKYGICRYRNV